MDRLAAAGVALFVLVTSALFAGFYDPLEHGDGRWTFWLLLCAPPLGLGLAAPYWRTLGLPLLFGVIVVTTSGDELASYLVLLFGIPIELTLTLVGCLVGRRLRERRLVPAVLVLAVALVPAGVATAQRLSRGPHVPPAVQQALPVELGVGNVCPGASNRSMRTRALAAVDALVAQLRRDPDALVTKTYYYEDGPQTTDITVRELAQDGLEELNGCAPSVETRIRQALSAG